MAEVNALNNRYQNGILKDDRESSMSSGDELACPLPPPETTSMSANKIDKKTSIRNKARDGMLYNFSWA